MSRSLRRIVGSIVAACVQRDCNATLESTRISAEATLGPRLDAVYAAIKGRLAPGARVVVLGYPRLFSTTACVGTTGIRSSERANANLLADEIDRVTGLRAAAFGFDYRSVIPPFTGHAVCAGSAWVNGLSIFDSSESFHPKRTGHSAGYLPLVRAVVG